MRSLARLLGVTLLLGAQLAHAAPAAPLAGQGGCPVKNPVGSLRRIATGPLAGTAASAPTALPAFAQIHAGAASGEPEWLRGLSGIAGPNREYIERGRRTVVLTVCEAAGCSATRAYVAFEPASGDWGVTVVEGRHLREVFREAPTTTLAMHPELIGMAILCAMTIDQPAVK